MRQYLVTKMRSNIELTNGLIYAENISLAMAKDIGKETAHTLVEKLCKEAIELKIPLIELVKKNDVVAKYISLKQINDLFDPFKSMGLYDDFINKVIAEST